MPNDIPERQNLPEFIKKVAAARGAYNSARKFGKWQVGLAATAAILGPAARILYPEGIGPVAIYSCVVLVVDIFFLEVKHKELRALGAKIQEVFDTELFGLPWNRHRCGSVPDAEDINRLAENFKERNTTETFLNWYPRIVGVVPLEYARFVCQRANMRWDMELRKKFSAIFYAAAAAIVIAIVLLASMLDLTMTQFAVSLALPAIPAALKLVREGFKHAESAQTSQKAKDLLEDAWKRALHKQISSTEMLEESRRLQDELFDRRRGSPIIPQLIYDRFRSSFEQDMDCAAQHMVRECQSALGLENS